VTRSGKAKFWIWAGVAVGIGIVVAVEIPRVGRMKSISGAVVIADPDPHKQLPIPGVEITGEVGGMTARTWSDATGFFRLTWRTNFWRGQGVTLRFSHADYRPLATTDSMSYRLYIAHLTRSVTDLAAQKQSPEIALANVRIRYSVKATDTIDVGSTAKTFEVAHTANIPCVQQPCSPDSRWSAAIGSFALDAGEGQEFQNARVSCVAGPCPFTRLESDGFSHGGRTVRGSVRAWSDTVTFLVEAEVVRTALSDRIRQSYPSIFGRTMTFTLPPNGEGPSIQAEVDGGGIVYPLGPALILSWASCNLQVAADRSKLYSCVLKSGYRFR
jgi:hypothetical protein